MSLNVSRGEGYWRNKILFFFFRKSSFEDVSLLGLHVLITRNDASFEQLVPRSSRSLGGPPLFPDYLFLTISSLEIGRLPNGRMMLVSEFLIFFSFSLKSKFYRALKISLEKPCPISIWNLGKWKKFHSCRLLTAARGGGCGTNRHRNVFGSQIFAKGGTV